MNDNTHQLQAATRSDAEAARRTEHAERIGRKGDWMQTASGKMFWPLDPRPNEVHIEDIAHALGNMCRYGGMCDYHYSVAQHSVYVSYEVPPEHALVGLLHDATEAYCVDVPRPIKRYLAGYNAIETRLWECVAERFGLPREMPECIHLADNAVLLAEKAQIMRPSPAPWSVPGEPARIRISQWSPGQARDAFLRRFQELTRPFQ